MEYISEIAEVHKLTATEAKNLTDYFFYLNTIPGNADVSKFVQVLLKSDRKYIEKFIKSDKMIFIVSQFPKDMNKTKAPTEDEILTTISLFFKTLKEYKGKISRETVSFYLYNYTGYGLDSVHLKNKTPEKIKELRFSGAYRTFKKLPADGFWYLHRKFASGKLPSTEDMY